MENPTNINLTLQFLVSLITVLGAGVSVYVGLKIANAENRKDITFLTKEIEKLEKQFTSHTENHPSRDQISAINRQLTEVKTDISEIKKDIKELNRR